VRRIEGVDGRRRRKIVYWVKQRKKNKNKKGKN
jgi:hypothetical protein